MPLYRVVILFFLGVEVLRIVGYVRVLWKTRQGGKANPLRVEDLSDQGPTPPPGIAPLIEEMKALGFTRLGEVQLSGAMYNPPLGIWILLDADRCTTCDLHLQFNPDRPASGRFLTMFDGGCVTTDYRLPHPYMFREVNDPDFRARNVSESLTAVFRAHQQDVAEMRARRGAPLECHTLQDHLAKDRLYIEKYHPRHATSRAPNELVAGSAIFLGDLILSMALLVTALLTPRSLATVALVMAALGLPLVSALYGSRLVSRFYGEERMRKSRKS